MRVDVFLHKVCLLRSRTLAGEACGRGRVRVNDAPARASHLLHPGDRIAAEFGSGLIEIEVLAIPEGNVARRDAREYYRILRDERSARPVP